MRSGRRFNIPYVKQDTPRMCGAAVLEMVYRSWGLSCSQSVIWTDIASHDQLGRLCARTNHLAEDVMKRGFSAIVMRVKHHWPALRRAVDNGVQVILNHRMTHRSIGGHFSVLLSVDDHELLIHDPLFGPDRRLSREDFLTLWTPVGLGLEVSGHVMVALSSEKPVPAACSRCATPIPESIDCPCCQESIPIAPASALGCIVPGCPERVWDIVFCPFCDRRLRTLSKRLTPGGIADSIPHDPIGSTALDHAMGMVQLIESLIDKYPAESYAACQARDHLIEVKGALIEQCQELRDAILVDPILSPKSPRRSFAEKKYIVPTLEEILVPPVDPTPVDVQDPTPITVLRDELLAKFGRKPQVARSDARSRGLAKSAHK